MHGSCRTDRFAYGGADGRRGKLALFAAGGPRDPGPLERVVLRVSDLEQALANLPGGVEVERSDGIAAFDAPEGLGLGLVAADASEGPEYDIDHVVLRVPEPERTAEGLRQLGF